jgi:transcriptional regulator with XRE-family HTH domain
MTLKELRVSAGKSRAEVASKLNVTVQAVGQYERGFRRLGIEQVKPLSELYDVVIDELVDAAILTANSCR